MQGILDISTKKEIQKMNESMDNLSNSKSKITTWRHTQLKSTNFDSSKPSIAPTKFNLLSQSRPNENDGGEYLDSPGLGIKSPALGLTGLRTQTLNL